ncbi:hypothetical protein BC833DRAFT_609385 [Globomyces pollinis-pini]|nr:hypothetical protein BC833DRAFT_609385 [Globomyces pollinis-pini]
MEYIQGQTLRDYLLETDNLSIASVVGQQLALIHDTNLIHGDLTTSNLLLREDNTANVVWIDFGLSYVTTLVEDKAVDMYVLERSLLSTHPKIAKAFFDLLLNAYKETSTNSKEVIKRFEEVRLRGRKRTAFG